MSIEEARPQPAEGAAEASEYGHSPAATAALETLRSLTATLPGGERRAGQEVMTAAVADAIAGGSHALVEASTGTGKTASYLVPAALSGKRVIVSTATKALQDQLASKDLPALEAALRAQGRELSWAVLKGKSNYLCKLKASGNLRGEGLTLPFDPREKTQQAQQVAALREWAQEAHPETTSGDRGEAPRASNAAWSAVSVSSAECVGRSSCPVGQQCFAELARDRAKQVDVLVVNHHLVALDLHLGGVLPEHDVVILDEAHEFEEIVASALSVSVSAESLERLRRRCGPFLSLELSTAFEQANTQLGDALLEGGTGRNAGRRSGLNVALASCERVVGRVLKALEDKTKSSTSVELQSAVRSCGSGLEELQRAGNADERWVRWVEERRRGQLVLRATPLEVAELLRRTLLRRHSVIATSATLALAGSFEVVTRRLGFEAAEDTQPAEDATALEAAREEEIGERGEEAAAKPEAEIAVARSAPAEFGSGVSISMRGPRAPKAWATLQVESPFAFPRQGILYVPEGLPSPSGASSEAHGRAVREHLVEITHAAGGRTLGLFSTTRGAELAAEVLRAETELPVYLQHEEDLGALIRAFREEPASVLLGTISLWQGIDVPGPSCTSVVLDRIPFPRPDDPVATARRELADRERQSGFHEVYLHRAGMLLAQGVGRLIRSRGDRGVVSVLDPRLVSMSYSPTLLATLPPMHRTRDPQVALGALRRLDAAARAGASSGAG